jgi:hypothetical protein
VQPRVEVEVAVVMVMELLGMQLLYEQEGKAKANEWVYRGYNVQPLLG